MSSINIEPSAEGYANIGATFVAQVVADVKAARREDAVALIRSIIDIAACLGRECETQEQKEQLVDKLMGRV